QRLGRRGDQQVARSGRVLGGDRRGLGEQALPDLLRIGVRGEVGELVGQLRVRGQQREVAAVLAGRGVHAHGAGGHGGGGIAAQGAGRHDRRRTARREHGVEGAGVGGGPV